MFSIENGLWKADLQSKGVKVHKVLLAGTQNIEGAKVFIGIGEATRTYMGCFEDKADDLRDFDNLLGEVKSV